jgi:hypothetical protein
MKDFDLFKSAADLRISHKIRAYLISTLALFESGAVVYDPTKHSEPKGFNLASVIQKHERGVCACIFGWVMIMAQEALDANLPKVELGSVSRFIDMMDPQLITLFWGPINRSWDLNDVNLEQAIAAIRNYLIRGNACWDEVLLATGDGQASGLE